MCRMHSSISTAWFLSIQTRLNSIQSGRAPARLVPSATIVRSPAPLTLEQSESNYSHAHSASPLSHLIEWARRQPIDSLEFGSREAGPAGRFVSTCVGPLEGQNGHATSLPTSPVGDPLGNMRFLRWGLWCALCFRSGIAFEEFAHGPHSTCQ